MKKLFIILISALTSTLYFGQDATPQQTPPPTQFTITKAEGLSPFIVVKTEGKTKEELYKKTIEDGKYAAFKDENVFGTYLHTMLRNNLDRKSVV